MTDITILLRDIQTQIQAKGRAQVKSESPVQLHRRLYKAIKRRGWKMRLSHDHQSVFVSLRSVR